MNRIALGGVIAAALLLPACDPGRTPAGAARSAPVQVVVQRSGDDVSVSLKQGQTLVLEFEMNAGTGFEWVLKTPLNAGVLTGGASEDAYPPSGKPGQAGVRRFTFKASAPGKQDLKFNFNRGAPNPEFDQHAVFHVDVRN